MREKYLYKFLIILFFTASPFASAQEYQEPKSREVSIKDLIANLNSTDVHVAAQAARELGYLRAKEGVPTLLRVLQSSRVLSLSDHIIAKDKNSVSEWVLTDVKAEIIVALGNIGDKRAVPVLKKYLKKSPKNSEVFAGNVAWALYQITGKSYKYKDRDGTMKLFQKSVSLNPTSNKSMDVRVWTATFLLTFFCFPCVAWLRFPPTSTQ